ncbi:MULTISPECIES: DUF3426 domain-containing protein [Pseudomonas]|uniref:Transmembrane protein n=1 Tax=Pseudomonas fulva TaxID=47880 RepID=A0A0D0KR92_9PSED|nr:MULTISPECIES: DUF3426 domain-containing protein [Pseudomonas]KIP99452.1 transmembrane protein [Pseudomonas fulva]
MTESFVTQCPNCSTSFRVNLVQLGIAQGSVRCGACLQVFNAARQLREQGHNIPDMRAAAPAVPKAAPPAPAPAISIAPETPPPAKPGKLDDETLWIHDDLDLDDLDLDEELAKLEAQEQQLSRQFLELDQPSRQTPRFDQVEDDDEPAEDERWAEALLRDDPPVSKLELEPLSEQPPLQSPDFGQPPPPSSHVPDDMPPIPKTPGIRDLIDAPVKRGTARDDAEPAFSLSAQRDEEPAAIEPEPQDENLDEPPPTRQKKAQRAPRSEPNLRNDALFELEEEPLQLDWRPPRKPWGRWIGWGLLNLLAATALAGQYVIYHYAELARQDQYRPWFEQACPVIGCTLPSKVDIEQIKSSNLVVRSHPEFSGALVVDAILYNRAPFSQPFPLLEMRFADLNGQLIASRRFKPSEYLAGELAGQAEMPPQTPIHIALDILDPGARAVNYSLNFHSPE